MADPAPPAPSPPLPANDDGRIRLPTAWPFLAAALIAVMTWPVFSLGPTTGLDPSWQIGLHLAASDRLGWGPEAVFSYGPLGFLDVPQLVANPVLTALAVAWTLALQFAVALGIILGARRSLPPWIGVVVAFLVGILAFDHQENLALVVVIWALFAIQGVVPDRVGRVLVPLAGVLCGIAVLVKFNVAVLTVVAAGIAVWWLPPRRGRALLLFSGTLVATVLVLWTVAVGSPTAIPNWLAGTIDVASGFSAGLPAEDADRGWEYPAFILLVAAIAYLAWQYGPALGRARALSLTAVGVVTAFVYFKHGFVRHDFEHASFTFVMLLAVPTALLWRGRAGMLAALAILVAAASVALGVYAQAPQPDVADLFDPQDRAVRLGDQIATLVDPGRRGDERAEARRRARDVLQVPDEMVAAIGRDTVHVDPYEISAAWAYGLRWSPAPPLQGYVTYTAGLDGRAADRLADADGPQWILREEVARLDGRTRETESPGYLVALICNYTERVSSLRWTLLEHTPGRCSAPRPLGMREAPAGSAIPVPEAGRDDTMVVAALRMSASPLSRLRTLLYKPRAVPLLVLNDDYGARFALAGAPGPFLMRIAATTGFSEYAGGFGARTLRVLDTSSRIRTTFTALRVAPPDAPSRSVDG